MRFRKSIKVMPGVRLNLSKTGVSTSVGGRGATVNLSKRGARSTLSVPGTGLSWSRDLGWSENKRSSPKDEIDQLNSAAVKAIEAASKEADKVNAIGARVDSAITALNKGRGLTQSKAQTFEKRVLAEEKKLGDIEEKVHQHAMFLDAIESRLRGMQFGMFAGGKKRHRDGVAEAVSKCAHAAKDIKQQINAAQKGLSDKLSEVQDALDDLGNGA